MTNTAIGEAIAEKTAKVFRCIQRARAEKHAALDLAADLTRQDAAVLNVLRACECAIDIASMVIAHEAWNIVSSAGDAFGELGARGAIGAADVKALRGMVGFRDVAVHKYDKLDLNIVAAVIDRELDALARFAGNMLARYED